MSVADVVLRPMSEDEYDAWVPRAIEDYAAHHARMGSRPVDTALESAKKEFAELLPDGVRTSGHHLFTLTDADRPIGMLWLHVPEQTDGVAPNAFVYAVEVDETERGKGHGRAAMLAAEQFAREQGAGTLRLHVFGDNLVARALYESLGYETTNVSMAKPLE